MTAIWDHAKVLKTKTCWLWGGSTSNGYGQIMINAKTWRVHRLAYFQKYKNLPEDLDVCHKCDVRNCLRPDHLFLGTAQDNAIDSVQKGRQHEIQRTHCPRGHAYAGDNLIVRKYGEKRARQCRECQRIFGKNRRPRVK